MRRCFCYRGSNSEILHNQVALLLPSFTRGKGLRRFLIKFSICRSESELVMGRGGRLARFCRRLARSVLRGKGCVRTLVSATRVVRDIGLARGLLRGVF